jgi:hypothetical protein
MVGKAPLMPITCALSVFIHCVSYGVAMNLKCSAELKGPPLMWMMGMKNQLFGPVLAIAWASG